jgi:hypothetical protein
VKSGENEAKMAQKGPKMVQNGPKMTKKRPAVATGASQGGYRSVEKEM